jgi:2-polyprenyl-6-hydroxyphenyl methylase/3-demethylubiquinone-9 3-methyltransferase
MRRLGAEVVGIDPSPQNIGVARAHAADLKLDIDYRTASVDDLAAAGEDPFDIALNLEVVEHVADPARFLERSAGLVRPGGLMVVATINRTLKALVFAKIGAELVLRWLPIGAHDPRKFLKPEEVERMLAAAGLQPAGRTGVVYNPLLDLWRLSEDASVNYMVTAVRPSA